MEPQNLAVMRREILRRMRRQVALRVDLPVADGHEQIPLPVERQPRAEVSLAIGPGLRFDHLLHCTEAILLEAAPDHRGGIARAVGRGLRVAEVDEAVLGKPRVCHHIQQAALPTGTHRGKSCDRLGHQLAVANDAKPTGAFGDEHVAARQKGHRPWHLQPLGHSDETKIMQGRALQYLLRTPYQW